MSRREALYRAGALVLALVGILVGPAAVVAVCGVISLVNASDAWARLIPSRDGVARTFLAVMACLVLLIALGVVLDALPGGLSRTNWAFGWTTLGLAGLGGAVRWGSPPLTLPRITPVPVILIGILAAGVVAGSVLAESGVRHEERAPLLEFSAPWRDASQARVVVRSVSVGGRFLVRVLADGLGRGADAGSVELSRAQSRTATLTVSLPAAERKWVIELVPVAQGAAPERELILWRR